MTWKLASHYHLPAIDDAACLWSPAPGAYTVRRDSLDRWRADWNDAEPDQALPVTIGWVTWHILWWWDELLQRCLNQQPRKREDVLWPGSADAVRTRLERLSDEWGTFLAGLGDEDLDRPFAFPWSEERPLIYAVAWANVELMKNLAEIGAIRHQYIAQVSINS